MADRSASSPGPFVFETVFWRSIPELELAKPLPPFNLLERGKDVVDGHNRLKRLEPVRIRFRANCLEAPHGNWGRLPQVPATRAVNVGRRQEAVQVRVPEGRALRTRRNRCRSGRAMDKAMRVWRTTCRPDYPCDPGATGSNRDWRVLGRSSSGLHGTVPRTRRLCWPAGSEGRSRGTGRDVSRVVVRKSRLVCVPVGVPPAEAPVPPTYRRTLRASHRPGKLPWATPSRESFVGMPAFPNPVRRDPLHPSRETDRPMRADSSAASAKRSTCRPSSAVRTGSPPFVNASRK